MTRMNVVILLFPSLAFADVSWQTLVRQHCPLRGVPVVIAEAVIRVESAGAPYALNINGRSVIARTQAEAAQHLVRALQETANVDIGLMQINWRTWGPVLGVDPVVLLDPEINIRLGCRLLGLHLASTTTLVEGIGRYHSRTPWRQVGYAQRIVAAFE